MKPGGGTHCPTTLLAHSTGVYCTLVPKRGFVDTPIASNKLRKIRPTIVVILIVVSQNSISPYLRTLKKLNKIGTMRKIVIQIAGWMDVQYPMKFAAAIALLG